MNRYLFARNEIPGDLRNAVLTLWKTEWDGVAVPVGPRHTDESFVLVGTLLMIPLIFYVGWGGEIAFIGLAHSGWLSASAETILDYATVAAALIALGLTPVFLGLFPRAARWITWSLLAGWIAFAALH